MKKLPTPRNGELSGSFALRRLLIEYADESAEMAMQPFVADRVMRRITMASQPEEQLYSFLFRLFRPVAIASLLLILGFVGYNAMVSRSYEIQPTTTEVVFGLEPVSITEAFTADIEPLLVDLP
ncbi:MAG: hypothetical protein OXM02_11695 [Bacteroidota bacterium]|nr:hypothetical protein [Bacteroidota bacterium]MDE2957019.1 hypothetical protein [Bacteroidota bacterium]